MTEHTAYHQQVSVKQMILKCFCEGKTGNLNCSAECSYYAFGRLARSARRFVKMENEQKFNKRSAQTQRRSVKEIQKARCISEKLRSSPLFLKYSKIGQQLPSIETIMALSKVIDKQMREEN